MLVISEIVFDVKETQLEQCFKGTLFREANEIWVWIEDAICGYKNDVVITYIEKKSGPYVSRFG